MCHFEEKWVFNSKGRPSIWFRYVDDTFTLFDSKSNALQFLQYLNSCHVNIKFTIEFEENNVIPFLDVLIKRHNHIFSTSIYRKKTFTGLYTKWDSFTPRKYKVNLIRNLTFRCFRQGRSQDFSKGGSHCVKVRVPTSSPDCHYGQDIVMVFSPPVLGCLVKKGLQRGFTGTPGPPLATPLVSAFARRLVCYSFLWMNGYHMSYKSSKTKH